MKTNLKNTIQFWQLTFTLAKADFKIKTEGSYLGIFWHFLNPLLLFLTTYFIFKNITGRDIDNYPAYLLSGIIMFRFFQSTTSEATSAITNFDSTIKSLKFNYLSIPLSIALSNTFSHAIEFLTLVIILKFIGPTPIELIYYPLIFVLLLLFTIGLTLFFSAITTIFRDTISIWSNTLRIIWFATPIFYSTDINPLLKKINLLANPMFYFIEMLRTITINQTLPPVSLVLPSILFTIMALVLGLTTFKSLEKKFSENL